MIGDGMRDYYRGETGKLPDQWLSLSAPQNDRTYPGPHSKHAGEKSLRRDPSCLGRI